ncbi:MAG: radical SAM protein [Chloroflexi bacterium]|nr:radical SAM protein [Chloroflexota bacterium]
MINASLSDKGTDLLRVSVTDQYNILCIKSRNAPEKPPFSDDPLTFPQIESVARAAVSSGIKRIRITGGEPLLRPSLVDLVSRLSKIEGIEELSLSTNATLLAPQAAYLKAAGLDRVNVCTDTFDPEKYPLLTGTYLFPQMREGVKNAMLAGFSPVYIDVVLMRSINTDEVDDLMALSCNKGIVVRFIELLPSMGDEEFFNFHHVPGDAIYSYLANRYWLEEIPPGGGYHSDTGSYYNVKSLGVIAILSPYSSRFEKPLSRLKVSAKGILKVSPEFTIEADLRPYIDAGDIDGLAGVIGKFSSGKILDDIAVQNG